MKRLTNWVMAKLKKAVDRHDGVKRNSDEEDEETIRSKHVARSVHTVGWAMCGFSIAGIVFVLLFSFVVEASVHRAWLFGALVLIAGASGFVAGLVGFLFGIPKILENPSGAIPAVEGVGLEEASVGRSYLVNTNLEEVSDWLTKMLVGVGLTQLTSAPGWLWSVSGAFARSLSLNSGGDVAICAMSLYFASVGFLTGYLMTRLYLSPALAKADGTLQRVRKVAKKDRKRIANLDMMIDDLPQVAKSFLRENWTILESDSGYEIPDDSEGNQLPRHALSALLREKLLVRISDGDSFEAGKHVIFTKLARKLRCELREMIGVPPVAE